MTSPLDEQAVRELIALPVSARAAKMRQHFAEHGFYRPEDLEWLLSKPGQSAVIENGKAVLRG